MPWVVKVTDHSYWNDIHNWQALWDEGVRVVILRITAGATYKDPDFPGFYAAAKSVGFKVLVYHAMNPFYSGEANFLNFAAEAGKYDLDGPPVLDVEVTAGMGNLTVQSRTRVCADLMANWDELFELIIYTRKSWWDLYMGASAWARRFFLWVAQYFNALSYQSWPPSNAVASLIPVTWQGLPPFLWQFSERGLFPAVSPGWMDKNVGYQAFVDCLAKRGPHDGDGDMITHFVGLVNGQNVRAGPGTTFPVVQQINAGTVLFPMRELVIKSSSEVWARFDIGWVAVVHGGTQYLDEM